MGVGCAVIAPSLVPVAPGDKVKTDRRDARRLVRLFRAGELVTVRVPTREEEGCRDLSRLRAAAMVDRRRARQRLGSFLLRHHLVYRDGRAWTLKHRRWLRTLAFDETGTQATFAHLLASVEERELRVDAIDADLAGFFDAGLFADEVARLGAYRGIAPLSALGLACEVCDWRRFPAPAKFMGFVGLVPAEYSTGASVSRYGITKSGNAHVRRILVEAAWAYRYPARVSPELARRHQGVATRRDRSGLERPGPPVWTVPSPRRTQRPSHRRRHRDRPRTRRVRVGRNDRLTMNVARVPRRSARGTTRARSQDASATASAGTDPRVVLRTTVHRRSSACTVWGNHLRMNTLRFRPADVRVADSRSTWCRRVLHHPPRPPPTRAGTSR